MKLDRRRFIKRAASSGFALGAATLTPAWRSRIFAAAATSKPVRVCLLSGSEEYKSNESLATFQQYLEDRNLAQCSRAFWTSKSNLPGLESLDSCDVMLLFTKRLELPPEQLDRVKRYCRSGRPIIGLRTASHAFQNWLELDRDVLGGSYGGHYGLEPIKVTSVQKAAKHPILKGFESFETTSKLYKNPTLANDTTLLLRGNIPDHTEPLAWTREHRDGRVFYTSLGGPEEFGKEVFRNMLVNAIYWSVKRDRNS